MPFCVGNNHSQSGTHSDTFLRSHLNGRSLVKPFFAVNNSFYLLPEAVRNLKGLIARTKADVVIISDWRYGVDLYREKAHSLGYDKNIDNWNHLTQIFEREGIEISGITLWEDAIENRTGEIQCYLEDHSNIKRYVILDDCFGDNYESDPEIQKHLVFVDALKGLQEKDLMAACGVMNMQK